MTSPSATGNRRRTAATDVLPDIAKLTQLSDEQLEELVLANLGPDAAGLWESLIAPPLLGRVRAILVATQHRIDNDLRTRRSRRSERRSKLGLDLTSPYEQRYDQWRGRVTVFKRLVETRLSQTRAATADENHRAAALNHRHRNAVRMLAKAIDCHRRAVGTAFDPEPADRALWQVLDDVTVPLGPQGVSVPVRDMLDTYWSFDENHPSPPLNLFSQHAQKDTAMDSAEDDGPDMTEPPAPWPEDLEVFAEAVRPTTNPVRATDGKD
ncbi:hypothetical protein ATK30_6444 [Amycolatopsis echigonensis]|uniref:Uncharacterized protein n=1 Tax=Amycolatopsis echigonensis TaxID=2576905 RepID=A0A2N3WNT5_9PSEU|nr:hypothetical protein ATK30_6444 [Amycolatopsis niigatensis]